MTTTPRNGNSTGWGSKAKCHPWGGGGEKYGYFLELHNNVFSLFKTFYLQITKHILCTQMYQKIIGRRCAYSYKDASTLYAYTTSSLHFSSGIVERAKREPA